MTLFTPVTSRISVCVCVCINRAVVQIKPHYVLNFSPIKYPFDLQAAKCVFTCHGFHYGNTNEKSLRTWSYIWKIVCRCDLYTLQDFYPGLSLIKLTDKRKHLLLLHRLQTFLGLLRPSCKDAAEWLIQPSCLSGSRSISSAARLTWIDDTSGLPLCTFVPFSHSVWTGTSGHFPRAPELIGTPDLNVGQEGHVQEDINCDYEMRYIQWAYISTPEHYRRQSWLSLNFNLMIYVHKSLSARDTLE